MFQGVSGLFSKPFEGAKERGARGFVKGVGQGVAGAVAVPVVGVLRAGESVAQGISGTANNIGNLGKTKFELINCMKVRIRPNRRIDIRGQIKIYDEDMAIINRYLMTINDGRFQNQIIKFYALLPTIDKQGAIQHSQKALLLITNEYIIFIRVFNFLDMQDDEQLLKTKVLLMSEKLSNIVNYNVKEIQADSSTGTGPSKHFMSIVFKKEQEPFLGRKTAAADRPKPGELVSRQQTRRGGRPAEDRDQKATK